MLSYAHIKKETCLPLPCVDMIMSHIQSWGWGQHVRLDCSAGFRGQNPSWIVLLNFPIPSHSFDVNIDKGTQIQEIYYQQKRKGHIAIRIIGTNSLLEFIPTTLWWIECTPCLGLAMWLVSKVLVDFYEERLGIHLHSCAYSLAFLPLVLSCWS